MDPSLPIQIKEDPRLLALQGYVACKQYPPKLEDARQSFANAIAMKSEPDIDYLRAWFAAERQSGFGVRECRYIADFVQAGRRYSAVEKTEFLSRKAVVLYNLGRELRFSDPSQAIDVWIECLNAHLICVHSGTHGDALRVAKAEEYSRNTCFNMLDLVISTGNKDEFVRTMERVRSLKAVRFDTISEPIIRSLSSIQLGNESKGELQRFKSQIESTFKGFDGDAYWSDHGVGQSVMQSVKVLTGALATKIAAFRAAPR